MQQAVIYTLMWTALWVAICWVLIRSSWRAYHCLALYASCLTIANQIDRTTYLGMIFASHIPKFDAGASYMIKSYLHLSRIIVPATITAALLWLGLGIEQVIHVELGMGYSLTTGLIAGFSFYQCGMFFSGTQIVQNTLWGLELFRAAKYVQKHKLDLLMVEANQFTFADGTPEPVLEQQRLMLNASIDILANAITDTEQEIRGLTKRIATVELEMR